MKMKKIKIEMKINRDLLEIKELIIQVLNENLGKINLKKLKIRI